jgi:type I restriction enzyme, S subunit
MSKISDLTKLDDYCELIVDCPHSTPVWTDSGYIVIRNQNIKNGVLDLSSPSFTNETHFLERTRRAKPRSGDLVFTREAPMGEICMVPNDLECCVGQRQVLLRAKKTNDSAYLLYAFQTPFIRRQIDGHRATGSTVSNFCIPDLKKLLIPRIPNESKVASVLSTLDAKIALNHRINGELEGMAKFLYDYWFVQYDFPLSAAQATALGKPRLAGKPYRTSGGPMVYHDQLKREIPKGWKSGTAKDLFVFNPTISIKKGAVAAYLDMDALPTTGFMTKQIQRKEFNGGTKFTNGDVLVARITPCLENGKTGLVSLLEENEMAFGSTEFIVLRGRSLPLSSFACCLSRSDYFRKYAIGNMTGTSGRKRLEAPILEKLPLSIPPTETLAAFEKICHPLFTLMTEHTKQNQELTTLRDWLLPMLMNGQVTVR